MTYKVSYLPIALDDILNISSYITYQLNAPEAAERLLNAFEENILRISGLPYSCRLYGTSKVLKNEYRVLIVDNYIVFYIVLEPEHVVEIHRVVYGKMDINKILN